MFFYFDNVQLSRQKERAYKILFEARKATFDLNQLILKFTSLERDFVKKIVVGGCLKISIFLKLKTTSGLEFCFLFEMTNCPPLRQILPPNLITLSKKLLNIAQNTNIRASITVPLYHLLFILFGFRCFDYVE